MIETIGIPIACVTFAVLLLWFIIGTKGQWALKMLVTAISIYFCVCLWSSLNGLLGWPTASSLMRKKIQILWLDIKEPNKKMNDPGLIYVWVKHLEPEKTNNPYILRFHTKNAENEPRLYKIPYSRKLHEQCCKIKSHLAKGGKFRGQLGKKGFKGEKGTKGKGGQGGQKGKGGRKGGGLSQEQVPIFHQLPPPHYQDKDGYGAP